MHTLHQLAPGTGDYPTLLVIDDAYINRTLLAEGLKSEYRVLTAESGEIGLKMAEAELPDAILLDVMMPDMDGFAVAKILTANPALSHIPVFFLTALSDQASQVSCLELGAVDFLTKPFSLNILRKRIANVIERDRLRANAVRSQAELNESLAKQTAMRNSLEAIFNASSDALIVTQQDFTISRVNGNAVTLLDQTHNELVGASLRHFLLKDLKGSTLTIEDILSSATTRECQLCNHETEHKFVSIQGQVFETSDNTTGYLFSLQDISQRIALDAKRRQAEKQRNDALFELGIQKNAMDEHALVSITDVKGNITYVNEKFCLTSGFDASELLGKSHRLIKSELHSKEFYAQMWGVISSGKTWHGEITNRSKDGTHYTVASTIVPWLNERGVPYQYVAIRTDVTAQKNAEKELALARQRELSVGASIQQSLLFGKPPVDIRGLAVACFTEASQGVDGDFYTFNELSSYCFELLVGDVMGKGVTAALIGAGIKNTYYKTISTLMNQREDKSPPSPAEILNAMHLVITPELMRINSFVTLSLVRVDRREGKVTWVNAGHTPTLLSRRDGQEIIELLGDNLPLGIMEDEVYQQHIDAIDSGDALLIYSDGITEATNPEKVEYGPDRVKNILQLGSKNKSYPPVTITALRSDLGNFTHHAKNADDSTAILIQINPVRAGQRGSVQDRRAPDYLELPRQLDQLSQLRHRMAQFLKDQPEDFTDQMQLACFEAATNVIRHGAEHLKKAPMTIAFTRNTEAVTVEIIYEGSPFVPKEAPAPDFSGYSEGGFGLFIIESSVSKVTYDSPLPGMARIQLVKNLER